ncbi:amino acid permease [Paenibacillus sp. LHD-117]|uniref:amino acid permease n=1 Tax=Paenibacillus sp. LHD-117 TaxID=3071412 RepID=UPI0027E16493|nr:amino acid permease [Paenibacillus sp. LHD-117]MDQ6423432.1 amino acid permease [Paenibacillus sp. LHD-117]
MDSKNQQNKQGKQQLMRGLKARHMTMIALGGSIGTGLFLASGGAIHSAGPGGALLAYAAIGFMVYFLMTSLGEMAAYMPVSGSFSTYAARFVDPAFGFALGWNYWFNWAITLAAEISAATLIVKYWFPDSPTALWTALFLGIIFFINYLSVRAFGESEYWFSMIKVVTVLVFIGIGILMIAGIMGNHDAGFRHLTEGDAPFHGGFMALLGVFMTAGFSFQGTELIGVAAGESEEPSKNVPKAVKQIFWRILLFYILAIFIIGTLISYQDPLLLQGDITNIAVSPFTIVFERAGFAFAASVMNAIILTSVLSAGSSGLYASTRMLWVLAKEGKAPGWLKRLNHRGIPVTALVVTSAFGLLAFLASLFGEGKVYVWLLNASGMCGFLAWLGIAISHYRFRRAFAAQGRSLDELPYKAKWFPIGPIVALIICVIVMIGQGYSMFREGNVNLYGIAATYIGLPLFLAVFLGYKVKHRTRVIPLEECRLED